MALGGRPRRASPREAGARERERLEPAGGALPAPLDADFDRPATALAGAGLWLAWAAMVRPSWTAVLLLLSPFVLVPLGLRLMGSACDARALPLAALGPAAGFAFDPGVTAAALTLPWLAVTVLLAASTT